MFKKIVLIATASLIAFAFTGCSKKPRRPNPLDTVMGPGYESGQQSDTFNSMELEGDGALLESRDDWGTASLEDLIARADRNMFSPVLFQFDSSAIAPTERPTLQNAADFLNSNPNAKLILEGHCDWRGTQEYNLALGDRRAKSALDYIVTMGVDPSRLKTLSQGDLKAIEGATSAQMAQERKVELLVIR
ncbi:OmpA family protein [Pelagicoccus mobilis]|uniref:OmpA family protein n=1 Tax=Pelagicoccus mobilis TaxID=415221 RepID=A0A934S080_9BACT|nr:OmpA family protein [Pelagicoccus mobilis]MBK1878594.1 OmpA family protein [Pelagicoccus mobilis]